MSGTYIKAVPSFMLTSKYKEFIEVCSIPNPVHINELHCTLIYSEGEYIELGTNLLMKGHHASIRDFEIWPDDNKNVLVAIIDSENLTQRHLYLREQYGFNHSYPEYKPHMTLSYNVPIDFDLSILHEHKNKIQFVIFGHEECSRLILEFK